MPQVPLAQVNVVVADMDASLAFYRRLGWRFERTSPEHSGTELANGLRVDLDSTSFVPDWDAGYRGGSGGTTVLGLDLPDRAAVDALYAELTAAGYMGRTPPWDAFWGSRFSVVEDPDGNPVGLMSPRDGPRGGERPSA